jgi:hypothetical protein
MIEQKADWIKPYLEEEYRSDFNNIALVPPEVALQLLDGWPNINPQGRQNRSPTMKKLIETCIKYQGNLSGYFIPVESGRDDARIQFDGIRLKLTSEDAKRLKRNLKPNSFRDLGEGVYSFWWD